MAENGEAGLGFKFTCKARPKVAVNVEKEKEQRQLITGVAGSVIQAAEPSDAEKKQYVIPKLENTYKTGVGKFVPTFVPESSTAAITGKAEDRYERAAGPDMPAMTSFGLQVRQRKDDADAANGAADASGPMVPATARGDEAAQLKADLEALPEEASVEDYEALPVEEFGKALLRGLGWSDGQGVGRKRQLVEPKQTIRRPDRLGLGANPAAPPPDKRPRKMGDKPKQDLVAAPSADGITRHRVGLDEQLVPRAALLPGPQPGKVMAVVGGRHAGLVCVVRELLETAEGSRGPARVRVELHPSAEVVVVSEDELGEKGARSSTAAADSRSKQQQLGQQEGSKGHSSSRGDPQRDRDRETERNSRGRADYDRQREDANRDRRDHHHHRSSSREHHRSSSGSYDRDRRADGGSSQREAAAADRRPQQQQQVLPPGQLWLAALIRVRVVDKRLQGGRLYLKKGVVLDVAPDGTADVRIEDSRQVVAAHQDQLETVVPREAGAAVMVVQGPHKGHKGRLLQVSVSSGAAALQLVGDMQVVRLQLDDVAQFMGHLDEEED